MTSDIKDPLKENQDSIQILFGKRGLLRRPPTVNSVLIVPVRDNWNDFGYRTRVDVHIRLESENIDYAFTACIGFLINPSEDSNGTSLLEKLLEHANGDLLSVSDVPKFFTMMLDMDAYRNLVRTLGTARSVEILIAMRDIVAFNEFKANATWPDNAVKTDIFLKSFVRNSEAYFAYKNAGSILRGLEHEEFRAMSNVLTIRFRLDGRLNAHEMTFQFDHKGDLPKRIAVIIGKNGVGKSQTLARIVRAALRDNKSLVDGDTNGRILVNRILAFAPTNETNSVFPSDRRVRPKVWYRRFSLNRFRSSRKRGGVADHVLQVARSDGLIGNFSRWDIFLAALMAIDNWEQICLPRRDKKRKPISLCELRRGGELSVLEKFAAVDILKEPIRLINENLYPLSSGEISFLRFAALASLHIENGSLLLLDEPETHLHPNFISQFVSLLDNLLDKTGSAAIIATHSVFFVREVFQEQVTVLRSDLDGYIRVEAPTLRTFGAEVGAISYFVFGEDEPSQLASMVERRLLTRFNTWDEVYARYKNELSLELLGSIRESMESGKKQ